nr:MAG TPA: DECORSIN (NMR, 25 STRUCTURES) COAGULATION [Caudoviricetes sp.]
MIPRLHQCQGQDSGGARRCRGGAGCSEPVPVSA